MVNNYIFKRINNLIYLFISFVLSLSESGLFFDDNINGALQIWKNPRVQYRRNWNFIGEK